MSGNQGEFIKTKITDFIKRQIDEGATLIFEDPAEHYGSTAISNILIRCKDISDPAFRVYTVLKSYAYGDKSHCFPGQETIARWIGKSRQTVNKLLGELRNLELIDWIQVGLNSPNVYIIKRIPQRFIDEYMAVEQELKSIKTRETLKNPDVKKTRHPENTLDVSKTRLPDVKKTRHEEYKNKQFVVVVGESQNLDNMPQNQEQEQGPPDQHQQNLNLLVEERIQELIEQVKEIAGVTISVSYAQEMLRGYSQEVISRALADLRTQVGRGMEFTSGVGAWLRTWLARNYEPDQKPPAAAKSGSIKSIGLYQKGQPSAGSAGMAKQAIKKREFIRSLYL